LGCTPNALKEPIKGILVFLIFIGAPRSVTVTSVPQGVSAPHVSGGAGGMGGAGGDGMRVEPWARGSGGEGAEGEGGGRRRRGGGCGAGGAGGG
jgi:hypothetical protein